MKLWDAWWPRNCWINPDTDDSIAFACCMVNIAWIVLTVSMLAAFGMMVWRWLA